MDKLSKICDAADWFDPELLRVIHQELEEPARFHRKQWEFAIIYLALQKYGLIRDDAVGLSMGGGNERVLYSIARRIKQLVVTDLYDDQTSWKTARTTDAEEFIQSHKPFPVDNARLKVLSMDMRELDFEDNSFDFCYSSCAVEHIGEYEDFLRHFNEVHRVLKPGGFYVFTTELNFTDKTIRDAHNYIFCEEDLRRLINESRLSPVADVNARLTKHRINLPFPNNIKNVAWGGEQSFITELADAFPHILLMRGKYPFTSVQFVLKKTTEDEGAVQLTFPGKTQTRDWLAEGVQNYRGWLEEKVLHINPFSASGPSRFFCDHAEFFRDDLPDDDTVFHTDYHWLGDGVRYFKLQLFPAEHHAGQRIQIRVHRYATLKSGKIDCIEEQWISLEQEQTVYLTLPVDDRHCYALLGKADQSQLKLDQIELLCSSRPFSAPGATGNELLQPSTIVKTER